MKTVTTDKNSARKVESRKIIVRDKKHEFKIPGTNIMVEEGDEMVVSGPTSYQQEGPEDAIAAFVQKAKAEGQTNDEIVADLVASFGMNETEALTACENASMGEAEDHPEPDADNLGGPSDHDADNAGEEGEGGEEVNIDVEAPEGEEIVDDEGGAPFKGAAPPFETKESWAEIHRRRISKPVPQRR